MPQTTQTLEDPRSAHARTALLGWSSDAMEALQEVGRGFIAVVPPEFGPSMEQSGVPYEPWDFERSDERAHELAQTLRNRGVELAVPLYEQTVEWAGLLNAQLRQDPRIYRRSLLFRDKAMMKRMAQMNGMRVGVFEEVNSREEVSRFLARVNKALLKLDEEDAEPVHLKPLDAAGTVGHRVIRQESDIHKIPDDAFPLLAESNLAGQEFSCEVFIHNGKIRFLNINEYVHLGHSNFSPASPDLEQHRDLIRKGVEQLIEAFGIDYGFIHPEFFLDQKGGLKFGEVAARVPGGHIFELIKRAYGFNPYLGLVLCWDPETSEEDLERLFPTPVEDAKGFAGCLMVYPKQGYIKELNIPDEVLDDPYFERHTLFEPIAGKVQSREGFGNHYGTVFLFGDDAEAMRDRLRRYEELDYYQ